MYVPVFLALAAAALDLAAVALGWHDTRWVTKLLPALLLAVAVFRTPGAPRAIGYGLLLAAFGDFEMLRTGSGTDGFLFGMIAFALMHVCYIAGFARVGEGPGLVRRLPWLAIPYVMAAIALDMMLVPHAGSFAGPLAIYSILLAAMAIAALNAAGRLQDARAARMLAGGALVFMLSDTLLALGMFWPGFFLTGTTLELLVMATYFVAQIGIVTGVICSTEQLSSWA
jgi:uncharacterized membrane protein YhhN